MGEYEVQKTEANAELMLRGRTLDANRVSQELGLPIDRIRAHGDYSAPCGNSVEVSPATAPDGEVYWTFHTQPKAVFDLNEALEDLILVFSGKTDVLRRLAEGYDAQISVCLILYNHQPLLPGISFSAEQIAFLAAINAELEFDIYHTGA